MKAVEELMIYTPNYCEKQDRLQNVVTEMLRNDVGYLPVVDKDKKVVGIITNKDICAALAKTNKSLSDLKVNEAMNERVHTCLIKDSTSDALRIMRTKKVGRLPVVDKEGRLEGVITLNSIVRKLQGCNERAEAVFAGKENVVNTLHSISERNNHLSFEAENFGE